MYHSRSKSVRTAIMTITTHTVLLALFSFQCAVITSANEGLFCVYSGEPMVPDVLSNDLCTFLRDGGKCSTQDASANCNTTCCVGGTVYDQAVPARIVVKDGAMVVVVPKSTGFKVQYTDDNGIPLSLPSSIITQDMLSTEIASLTQNYTSALKAEVGAVEAWAKEANTAWAKEANTKITNLSVAVDAFGKNAAAKNDALKTLTTTELDKLGKGLATADSSIAAINNTINSATPGIITVTSAKRDSAVPEPDVGQFVFLTDTNLFEYWNGKVWASALPKPAAQPQQTISVTTL